MNRRVSRLLSVLSVLAGVAVTVVVTLRVARDAQGVQLGLPLRGHLLAASAVALDVSARALRIVLLARGLGLRLSFPVSAQAQVAADAAGAVTPSRTGADPAKAATLRQELPWGPIAALLLGELTSEAILLLPVSVVIALAVPSVPAALWGGVGYAATVVLLGALALLLARRLPSRPPRTLAKLGMSRSRWKGLRTTAVEFVERSKDLRRLPAWVVAGVFASALVHMVAKLSVLPILAGASGTIDALGPLVAWPFLLLWGGALLPPPGGGGLVEAGFALTLREELSTEFLPAALLWWRFYTFYLTALVGGLVLLRLRPGRKGRPQETPPPPSSSS